MPCSVRSSTHDSSHRRETVRSCGWTALNPSSHGRSHREFTPTGADRLITCHVSQTGRLTIPVPGRYHRPRPGSSEVEATTSSSDTTLDPRTFFTVQDLPNSF